MAKRITLASWTVRVLVEPSYDQDFSQTVTNYLFDRGGDIVARIRDAMYVGLADLPPGVTTHLGISVQELKSTFVSVDRFRSTECAACGNFLRDHTDEERRCP